MISIWKYPMEVEEFQFVEMPVNSMILSVQIQNGIPVIWAKVNTEEKQTEKRKFKMVPTGGYIEEEKSKFLETLQFNHGKFILHVFEIFSYTGNELREKIFSNQKKFHHDLMKVVYMMAGKNVDNSWMVFHNGSFVLLKNDNNELQAHAVNLLKSFSNKADVDEIWEYEIFQVDNHEGFIVTAKGKKVYIFVHSEEAAGFDDETLGNYALLKLKLDIIEQNIIDSGSLNG